VGMDEAVM